MTTHAPRINPVKKFFATASSRQYGVLWGVLLFIFNMVRALFDDGMRNHLLAVAVINFVIWVIFGSWFFGRAVEAQFRKRDAELGIRLTAQDKLALLMWQEHGIKPTSERLQPVLSKYVARQQNTLCGKQMYTSKSAYVVFLVFAILLALGAVWLVIEDGLTLANGFAAVVMLFLLALVAVGSPGKPNPIMQFMYRRGLRKVAAMRRQLRS